MAKCKPRGHQNALMQDGVVFDPTAMVPRVNELKVARPSRSGSLHIGLDNQSLQTSEGENLPHWTCDNAIYHVSFRLADSVPNSRRNEWLAERNSIEENAKALGRELVEEEKKRLQFLYSERIEFFLDAGHGDCHLKKPEIAEIVAGALKHFDGERYHLHAWCVMPNHVHVIVEVARPSRSGITPKETDRDGLATIISFTAHEANKRLNRKGDFWQHDAYNHIQNRWISSFFSYIFCASALF